MLRVFDLGVLNAAAQKGRKSHNERQSPETAVAGNVSTALRQFSLRSRGRFSVDRWQVQRSTNAHTNTPFFFPKASARHRSRCLARTQLHLATERGSDRRQDVHLALGSHGVGVAVGMPVEEPKGEPAAGPAGGVPRPLLLLLRGPGAALSSLEIRLQRVHFDHERKRRAEKISPLRLDVLLVFAVNVGFRPHPDIGAVVALLEVAVLVGLLLQALAQVSVVV
ncbi:MAG: hypothetical protein BJ554DRAFT_3327 [Olpidium bornovanus]|uniref:Uncharacterized protein n=1 Tax=Olpidium bornovanus TaxID=278681 RepID=A0A8H7ZNM7_9FUNG|nr:MAG: hypothetical protein BJ554DRAFT_3327 [Olpidium bornovanus]